MIPSSWKAFALPPPVRHSRVARPSGREHLCACGPLSRPMRLYQVHLACSSCRRTPAAAGLCAVDHDTMLPLVIGHEIVICGFFSTTGAVTPHSLGSGPLPNRASAFWISGARLPSRMLTPELSRSAWAHRRIIEDLVLKGALGIRRRAPAMGCPTSTRVPGTPSGPCFNSSRLECSPAPLLLDLAEGPCPHRGFAGTRSSRAGSERWSNNFLWPA